MSNNTFSRTRFLLLFKQHFIHNSQFLLLSIGAYVGLIFIVLSFIQVTNELEPNGANHFQELMILFVTVFGILFVGHSFPAFRSKESTINYLMIPASTLEKFAFEFVNRIVIVIITLPLLFWLTFHVQGYFFSIFSKQMFIPVGLNHLIKIGEMPIDYKILIYSLITSGVFFALSLAFTGSAMFTKQPLVKTLFSLAIIILFFVGYSFIIIEPLGLGDYHLPDQMLLFPLDEESALKTLTFSFFTGTIVMLVVAFRKLKEREV